MHFFDDFADSRVKKHRFQIESLVMRLHWHFWSMRHSRPNGSVFIFSPGAVSDDASDCERDGCSPGQQASLQERVARVRELERDDLNVCSQKRQRKQGRKDGTRRDHRFSALPYITTPACLLQHASSPYRTALCNPPQISQRNLPIKHGNGWRNATNGNFSISLFWETEASVFQEEALPTEGGEWEGQKSSLSASTDGICTFFWVFLQFPLGNFNGGILCKLDQMT